MAHPTATGRPDGGHSPTGHCRNVRCLRVAPALPPRLLAAEASGRAFAGRFLAVVQSSGPRYRSPLDSDPGNPGPGNPGQGNSGPGNSGPGNSNAGSGAAVFGLRTTIANRPFSGRFC